MYHLWHLWLPLLGLVSWTAADRFQKVLGPAPVHAAASASGGNWSVREQYDSVCKAKNRHFAGRVNVTSEKDIFFWFFESKESPNEKPVVIWLNGGPGASSLAGLFGEVGPCQINEHSNDTVPTDYSWTDYVNLLFIDQPAGVGLSILNNKTDAPHNLDAASPDFLKLLKVFYGNIFPQYAKVPLYVAGESYGGRYVPRYAADILREQQIHIAGSLQQVELGGIILVNALVEISYLSAGQYDLFCTDKPPNLVRFNETTCKAMGAALPECEKLGSMCRASQDAQLCLTATTFCYENIDTYFNAEVEAHRHSPYDLRRDCPEPPLCGVGGSMGSLTDYLNQPEIQDQLGFHTPIEYQSINFKINSEWAADPLNDIPTTADLTFLLDAGVDKPQGHIDPDHVVPVLVLNGEYDVGCNGPGNMALYDSLRWHRQAAYRAERGWKKWYWSDLEGKTHEGGAWKGTPQRQKGLEFVTIKDAGHMAPGDQPGAAASIFGRWVANGGLLEDGDLGQPAA